MVDSLSQIKKNGVVQKEAVGFDCLAVSFTATSIEGNSTAA